MSSVAIARPKCTSHFLSPCNIKKALLAVPLSGALMCAGMTGASAQEEAEPLTHEVGLIVVNVDLRNARILNNVARDLEINVSNVPITVQAPVNVAAVVCDVNVNLLATAFRRGGSTCSAQQTNSAFLRIVQRAVNLQDRF